MLAKSGHKLIIAISVAVPLVVVVLMFLPQRFDLLGVERSLFPLFHAVLNGSTALLLCYGLWFIKHGQRDAHRMVMTSAFVLSAIFLVSYVIAKISHAPVPYPQDAPFRFVYLFILITHIVLSGIILPLVLFTMWFAWNKRFDRHKKIARWTFPIWLYVAITGVLVYVFMQPYY